MGYSACGKTRGDRTRDRHDPCSLRRLCAAADVYEPGLCSLKPGLYFDTAGTSWGSADSHVYSRRTRILGFLDRIQCESRQRANNRKRLHLHLRLPRRRLISVNTVTFVWRTGLSHWIIREPCEHDLFVIQRPRFSSLLRSLLPGHSPSRSKQSAVSSRLSELRRKSRLSKRASWARPSTESKRSFLHSVRLTARASLPFDPAWAK